MQDDGSGSRHVRTRHRCAATAHGKLHSYDGICYDGKLCRACRAKNILAHFVGAAPGRGRSFPPLPSSMYLGKCVVGEQSRSQAGCPSPTLKIRQTVSPIYAISYYGLFQNFNHQTLVNQRLLQEVLVT